jgi:hypothetical protein
MTPKLLTILLGTLGVITAVAIAQGVVLGLMKMGINF